ncbi:hypothetical protein [Streptomyces sp. NPDC001820]|uniref:hypothetical protein n=1 Tax=Streptomyces sp. NPDC001820 TaxID=3364613 RepID=UPI00368DAFEE
MRLIRWAVGCGMIVTASLLTVGCSSEEPRRSDSPKGWAACNEFFGCKNIDTLDKQMDEGELRIENQLASVEQLASSMASQARSWEPGSEAHWSVSYEPCRIAIPEKGQRFSSDVRWSKYSVADLESGKAPGAWSRASGDVFTSEALDRDTLQAAFPCKVSGTHKQQEDGLPLQVRVRGKAMSGFDEDFRGKLTSALARKMSGELGCVNEPQIPGEL